MPDYETDLSRFGTPRALIGNKTKNTHSLKCKNCGKFFAANITADGQLVHCPECTQVHVIRTVYRAVIPGEVSS